MRKIFVALALVMLAASPVLATTNPFADVPLNHWSYDAVAQLAARGVLSGYPDYTYKGRQPATRYEMAAVVARAMMVVDFTKASAQDAEMLKRLAVEFADELDALGVKVDQADKRLYDLEERLGGWKLSGVLWQTFDYVDGKGVNPIAADPSIENESYGTGGLGRARIYFDRWFGADEDLHFFARLSGAGDSTAFDRFWATTPAWGGTTLRVGRYYAGFIEEPYYIDNGPLEMLNTYSVVNTRKLDMAAISKAFHLGEVTAYVARPASNYGGGYSWFNSDDGAMPLNGDAWELALMGKFQLNERFGLDLGVNAILGDDATTDTGAGALDTATYKLDSLYTLYGGLRFEFTPSIGLRGMYYHQSPSGKSRADASAAWDDADLDSASAYTAILDVKQDLLKFTALWLQYQKFEKGFSTLTTYDSQFEGGLADGGGSSTTDISFLAHDWTIMRVLATQNWNATWRTYEFYTQHKFAEYGVGGDGTIDNWGAGVEYRLNPSVVTGVTYYRYSYSEDFARDDDSVVRWTTSVSF
jgi:hypothetical protein